MIIASPCNWIYQKVSRVLINTIQAQSREKEEKIGEETLAVALRGAEKWRNRMGRKFRWFVAATPTRESDTTRTAALASSSNSSGGGEAFLFETFVLFRSSCSALVSSFSLTLGVSRAFLSFVNGGLYSFIFLFFGYWELLSGVLIVTSETEKIEQTGRGHGSTLCCGCCVLNLCSA